MKYRPVLVTPPATDPVTLDEVKAHLRVIERDGNGAVLPHEDDDLIGTLIKSAVAHLDGWTGVLGRCLVEQTWRQDFDCFTQCMRLPLGPVKSISEVRWRNAEGQMATVASESYALETSAGGSSLLWFRSSFARPSNLYERAAVSVDFVSGFGNAAAVPAALKVAIFMMVAHWYQQREAVAVGQTVASVPMAVDALIAPFVLRQL